MLVVLPDWEKCSGVALVHEELGRVAVLSKEAYL